MVNYQEVEQEFLVENPHQLDSLVPKLLALAGDHKIWLFEGEMGAGKTTLVQAICKAMGVTDQVTSPSYSLLQEYHSLSDVYYHFDFYRVENEAEALDIGCDEYFDSGKICFIEWPEKVISILPRDYLKIGITVRQDEARLIKVYINE